MGDICNDCICIECRKYQICEIYKICMNSQEHREKLECPHGAYEEKDK